MPMIVYSLEDAVNYSFAFGNYFYVGERGDYLVIVNKHISVWKKINGVLEFEFNILHTYNDPKCYIEDGETVVINEKVELMLYKQDLSEDIIDKLDLMTLRFHKIVDMAVPSVVEDWYSTTTEALLIYDKLGVLSDEGFDVYDFKLNLFSCVFLTPCIEKTVKILLEIDE